MIISTLRALTTFFCTFLHVCARFGNLANSVRESLPTFAASTEGKPSGRLSPPPQRQTKLFYGPQKTKDYGNQLFNRGKKEPQPARRGRTKFRDKAQASGASTGRRKTGRKPRRLERTTSGR